MHNIWENENSSYWKSFTKKKHLDLYKLLSYLVIVNHLIKLLFAKTFNFWKICFFSWESDYILITPILIELLIFAMWEELTHFSDSPYVYRTWSDNLTVHADTWSRLIWGHGMAWQESREPRQSDYVKPLGLLFLRHSVSDSRRLIKNQWNSKTRVGGLRVANALTLYTRILP